MGIKVLSLFDGISCGQIALERANIKVDKYYASEIKKPAIETTLLHYPNTIQVGDVTDLSYKNGILYTKKENYEVGKIDLLIGGSPCFVGDTLVLTTRGYKTIKDIKYGDKVLSHNNQYNVVINLFNQGMKDLYEIKGINSGGVKTTLNHKFWVRKKIKENVYSSPHWLSIEDLLKINYKDYFIGYAINQENKIPNLKYNLDYSDSYLWYIVGMYLNGELQIEERSISCSSKGLNILKQIYFLPDDLKGFLKEFNINNQLQLPGFVFDLPIYLLKALLMGYSNSDKENEIVFIKSNMKQNKLLTYGLMQCIMKVYNIPCFIQKENEEWTLTFNKEKQLDIFYEDNYVWTPIKDISNLNKQEVVYDIEVENSHSFTANGYIVHNCQNFSIARVSSGRERDGLKGDKSRLFYEYLRLKEEINPRFFLLENVKMKKQDEEELNTYLGVKGLHINSSLVSYQLRNRIYWTNIRGVTIPEDKHINFQDFKDTDFDYCKQFKVKRTPCRERMWNNGKGKESIRNCNNITYATKIGCLTRKQDRCPNSGLIEFEDFCRYLTRREIELAQTLPLHYTDNLSYNQMQDVCGDGWTIDVIAHIFKFLKIELTKKEP